MTNPDGASLHFRVVILDEPHSLRSTRLTETGR
jgi:hypothetical protein